MSRGRVVFLGSTDMGYRCCERLLVDGRAEVVGIFTLPRAFDISYADGAVTNVQYRDFGALGAQHGVPVFEVDGRMGRQRDALAALEPDLLVVIGWYHMVPRSVRALAPLGCVGVHASLLPKYRGGAPLVWAMINGEERTGLSLFYFGDGVDDGDVVAQAALEIGPRELIGSLLQRATAAAIDLVGRHVPLVLDGTAARMPQDHGAATRFAQRSPADGRIDWSWPAARIERFIRAQSRPYPGAFTVIEGRKVVLWDADVSEIPADGAAR